MSAGRRRAAGTRALAALLAALSAPWSNACARTTPFSKDWANTVAICAIMRKEKTEDVREWLQYHRYIGVDHVLLHDNNEDGGQQAAELADFVHAGFLSYFTVPGEAQQLPVYQRCATVSGQAFSWLAAIDIDEFLVVEDERARGLAPEATLKRVLRDFRFQPALWLQWRGFGPGRHEARPEPGGPLAHYDHCMPLQWPPVRLKELREQRKFPRDAGQALAIVKYGKSIVNTFWVHHASTAHGFMYKANAVPVTDALQRVAPALNDDGTAIDHAEIGFTKDMPARNKRLVVHHYASRSAEDYAAKKARGAGDHARSAAFRDTGFFEALNASTIEHPSCNVALSLAQSCCRDGHGQPWPPVPRSVDIADLPITHLSPQDVPSVKDLGMVRGAKLRPGYPPPFSKEWQPTVAVCALRRDSTSDAALLEWLEHHRHIGVHKAFVYSPAGAPAIDLAAAADYPRSFVTWQEVDSDLSAERAAFVVRARCLHAAREKFAYVTFLHTNEYLIVRGKRGKGALRKVLAHRDLKNSPGIVLPVFEFEARSTPGQFRPGQPVYPLRHYTQCAYMAQHGSTRSLANTFWVDAPAGDVHFNYSAALLPVTDSLRPWVPLLADMHVDAPPDSLLRIGLGEPRARAAEMQRFGLTKPFGRALAVFVYPEEDEPARRGLSGRLWRQDAQAACKEGPAAADACCSWELDG